MTQQFAVLIYCLQETHFKFNDISGLKIQGWENIYCVNIIFQKAGMLMAIPNEVDFKAKKEYEKKVSLHMIKGSTHQEDIMTLNVYTPNNRASNYMKKN